MKKSNFLSLLWFVLLIALFLLVFSEILPFRVAFLVLAFAVLIWQGYFIAPVVWRWFDQPTDNVLLKYVKIGATIVLFAAYILLLYGFLSFAFRIFLIVATWGPGSL